MADILLSHANHLFHDRKQVRKMQPYPPLQTLIAAACLRERGFGVALFDSTFEDPETEFPAALEKHRPRLVALVEDNFNFLTKMCLRRNRESAFAMIESAGERGIPVVVNGSEATDRPALYLEAGAKAVVLGEPESALCEAAAALTNGSASALRTIPGLATRGEEGELRLGPPRMLVQDLDSIPPAAWDLVEIERYRKAWIDAHGLFSLNLASSRGCPFRCNWCAKPIYGDSYRFRSPLSVAAEMADLKRRFSPDAVWFADDIFALSASWTAEFADEVERLEARIPFKMQSRCDLMTRATVDALARAGCAEVWMGAESGSQRVLDAMDKDVRVEQIGEARRNLGRHGVRACFFLQFGYPGERWADIEKTVELVRSTRPDDIGVSVSYPLPGTRFHERVSAQLGDLRNWSDSEDLAMMFRGAYPTDFYRALHDALHLEVEVLNNRAEAQDRGKLDGLWRRVLELRETCAGADPTPSWTSC